MKEQNKSVGINLRKRTTVILVRPEKRENIGLVARNMKNTGFENLRLVNVERIDQKSYVTAVHAQEILDNIRFCKDMSDATRDIDVIFAATSRKRKNFLTLSLRDAVQKILSFPPQTKVGLLFGNERTGLTSEELLSSNYRLTIPQASRQPSYNLASAVLLTLFHIYASDDLKNVEITQEKPLPRKEQEECIRIILDKLEKKGFIHKTNKFHVTEMIYDLFGRLSITAKDRKLLLAIFSKIGH
ncbi:MAG: hypothetical protein E3J56_15715 [Candidatus Aminicenantes bacterium]|nr:MAG: hypothetical protein E3J56_15715 [Candidatus Aminicenantes bacterium]